MAAVDKDGVGRASGMAAVGRLELVSANEVSLLLREEDSARVLKMKSSDEVCKEVEVSIYRTEGKWKSLECI